MDGGVLIGKQIQRYISTSHALQFFKIIVNIFIGIISQTVSRLDPKFIALHCQEVGGKNSQESMRHVEDFMRYVKTVHYFRFQVYFQRSHGAFARIIRTVRFLK